MFYFRKSKFNLHPSICATSVRGKVKLRYSGLYNLLDFCMNEIFRRLVENADLIIWTFLQLLDQYRRDTPVTISS